MFQCTHAQNVLKGRAEDPRTVGGEKKQKKGQIIKIKQHKNEGRILTYNDLFSSEATKRRNI